MKECFHFSANAMQENRMESLLAQIKTEVMSCAPFRHVSVQFYYPRSRPLTIGELIPLNEWFNSLANGIDATWAANAHDSPTLLAVVELLHQ